MQPGATCTVGKVCTCTYIHPCSVLCMIDYQTEYSGVHRCIMAVRSQLKRNVDLSAIYVYCVCVVTSHTTTSDVEMRAQEVPVYEDMSELPQPTGGHEIFTEHNEAYGPVKSN